MCLGDPEDLIGLLGMIKNKLYEGTIYDFDLDFENLGFTFNKETNSQIERELIKARNSIALSQENRGS